MRIRSVADSALYRDPSVNAFVRVTLIVIVHPFTPSPSSLVRPASHGDLCVDDGTADCSLLTDSAFSVPIMAHACAPTALGSIGSVAVVYYLVYMFCI